jgi:hypothetical protein
MVAADPTLRGHIRREQNVWAECGRLRPPPAWISARFVGEHPAFAAMVAAEPALGGQIRREQNV